MKKILIVEDELPIAELEKDYLELSGFEVVIETDGKRGYELAKDGNFNLIILDLMLPNMKSVASFEILQRSLSLWFLQKKRILIRSEDLDSGQMII